MDKNLIFEGVEEDYRVYRNSDGFMEGYKAIGKPKSGQPSGGTEVKRIVTNQTTLSGFAKYVRGLRRKTPTKEKALKASELPNLPFPD